MKNFTDFNRQNDIVFVFVDRFINEEFMYTLFCNMAFLFLQAYPVAL